MTFWAQYPLGRSEKSQKGAQCTRPPSSSGLLRMDVRIRPMAACCVPLREMVRISLRPLELFRPCEAVASGGAADSCSSDSKAIVTKVHVDWGQSSAHQSKRVFADPNRETMGLANSADEALGQCEICRTREKAQHIPIAGTSAGAAFSWKLRVDSSFLDDVIAPRAVGVFYKLPLLIPARPEFPQEARDVLRSSRLAISGWPEYLQAGFCAGRRMKLRFQEAGDAFSSEQTVAGAEYCLNSCFLRPGTRHIEWSPGRAPPTCSSVVAITKTSR